VVVIYAKGFYPSPHARYGHILAFFRTNLPSPSIVRSAHASHILINSGTGSFYPAFFLSRIKSVLSQCVHFYFFFYFFFNFSFLFSPLPLSSAHIRAYNFFHSLHAFSSHPSTLPTILVRLAFALDIRREDQRPGSPRKSFLVHCRSFLPDSFL